MASCNCRGGPNCCLLHNPNLPYPTNVFDFSYPSPTKMKTGTIITIYLHTEDERKIVAIAEAVGDTLDIAAGRPKTSADHLPYLVTVGETQLPEETDEFVKMVAKDKTIIICPRPISEDNA